MKTRFLSFLLVLGMLIPWIPVAQAAGATNIQVEDIVLTSKLRTVTTEELYNGDSEDVTYENLPTTGMQYLLVHSSIAIEPGNSLDLDSLTVVLNGKKYARTLDDSFLEVHGYGPLEHTKAGNSTSGWALFEIPVAMTESQVVLGVLQAGSGIAAPLTKAQAESPIVVQSHYETYGERQAALEDTYLAALRSGKFTADNPYIVVNPYEIAPLSALVLFATKSPAQVTTTIVGHSPETSITNKVSGDNTFHQIPLLGLYEGKNTVEIAVTTEGNTQVYTYEVETQVNAKLPKVTVTQQDLTQLVPGLYLMKNQQRMLVDIQGEVRGYFTIGNSNSCVDEVTDDGHIWFNTDPYSTYSVLYEMDYMGRVYEEINMPVASPDHDGYLYNENTFLVEEGILNLQQGTFTPYGKSWNQIFNQSQGSAEVRCFGGVDWLHFNTIGDGGDGDLLVSMRGQHAIAKVGYPDLEVKWVLSGNKSACPWDQDKYLTPIGEDFQWFYSQHHANLVSDLGNGIVEITVFDNGIHRGLDPNGTYPADEMYSRMVRYRIDENNMTVEQIWDYGQELGTKALSYVHGSTQYLEDSKTYVGSFDSYFNTSYGFETLGRYPAQIMEVNEAGEMLLRLTVNDYNYRAEKRSSTWLYSGWKGLSQPQGKYSFLGRSVVSGYCPPLSATAAVGQIGQITATEEYLNLTGWVANPNNLGGTVTARQLLLTNKITGKQYLYVLTGNTAQTKQSWVDGTVQKKLSTSAGFSQKHLNLNPLEDGDYSVMLLASQGGVNYGVTTEKILRIGDAPVVTTAMPNEDLLVTQKAVEQNLQAKMAQGNYTLTQPLVSVDPYGIAPLSAIAMFKTNAPATIAVQVDGLDGGDTLTHSYTDCVTNHIVPIYGLYSGKATNVTLTATYENGKQETSSLSMTGNTIPTGIPTGTVVTANTSQMTQGLTFLHASAPTSYTYAIDSTGTVRWASSLPGGMGHIAPVTPLENGHIFTGLHVGSSGYYKYGVQEMDLTGKVYHQSLLDGVHHDMVAMDNGNFLVLSDDPSGKVVEDTVFELDGKTGEIVRGWDMDAYFNVDARNEAGDHVADINYGENDSHDWIHLNSVAYDSSDNSMVLSGRQQDAVFKIDLDTGKLVWILSDPSDNWPADLKDKLLTPVGNDFQWTYGQHHVELLGNGELLLFDNGNFRSKTKEGALASSDNYSRIVRFAIDEEKGTVTQLYDYGQQKGDDWFATYIGGHQYLGDNHYLGCFGGVVKDSQGNAAGSVSAAFSGGASHAHIVELIGQRVVFQYDLESPGMTAATYRATRMSPYTTTEELKFQAGNRVGQLLPQGSSAKTQLPNLPVQLKESGIQATDCGFYIQLSNIPEMKTLDVYFVGQGTYKIQANVTNSACKILGGELPTGTYTLYYGIGNTLYHSTYTWKNTTVAKTAEPRYAITAISGNPAQGQAYGSGLYYGNTPMAVTAMAEDGMAFQGWKACGTIVSREMVYSFVPKGSLGLTAIFLPEDAWNSPFRDVIYGDWYYDTVREAVETGLFIGTETDLFSPLEGMTGEMVSIVLHRLSDGTYTQNSHSGATVSREVLASMLYDYAKSKRHGFQGNWMFNMSQYKDLDQVDQEYWEAMCWCVMKGILVGTGDSALEPNALTNRAEVATVMTRMANLEWENNG